MSYDIVLMPRRPGQSWDEAMADGSGDPLDLAELSRLWSRIEERLAGSLPGQVESRTAEADSDETTVGELTVLDTWLQVELYRSEAAVSSPYWEPKDPDAFHRQVTEVVRVVAEETGYEANDPQTERAFDGTFADEESIAFTEQLRAGGTVDPSGAAPETTGPPHTPGGAVR